MQMMFQLLTLVGAVTLFLFGLSLLSVGLQKVAGDGLRSFLASMTSNGFKRLLTGVGVTAAIQSSTATTIMVVSFVNAGLLTLAQAIGVIMGANIGTTVTAQMGRTLMVFFAVYLFLIFVSILAMVGMGHSLLNSFGLAISSFSNIGPTVGHEIGPLASWSSLSDGCLWLNSFLMLAGRLEIFSLLLPLTPAFWRDE